MKKQSILILSLFLFLINSTITIIVSFLPVYFQYQGFTGEEIGWLLAIGPISALFVQPIAGYLSDKWKSVKWIIILCLSLLILSSLFLFQIQSFWLLLAVSFVFFFFLSPIGPLGDSLAQKTSSSMKIPFGRIRMWGSVGFASVSLLTGSLLSVIGINRIVYPFILFAIGCIFVSYFLQDVTLSKVNVRLLDAFSLLKSKRMLLFLAIILFFSIPHRMNDFYVGLYINELGGNELYIGWAWFIGAIVEAAVFYLSHLWASRYHELTLLAFIGIVYTFRYVALASVTSPFLLLLLQPLHGFTFAIVYTASLQYVSRIVPDHIVGTSHLLFITMFFSISGIIASLFGGVIFEHYGGTTLYLMCGVIVFIGSMFVLPYRKSYMKSSGH